MKRFISILILAALLVGCGETAVTPETKDTTDSTESVGEDSTVDMSKVCELPDTDWEGREFRVLGREDPTYTQFNNFEIYAESENGDIVNDAVFRRNTKIEDKYNVKITQTLVNEPQTELQKAVLAQENLYDLAFNEVRSIGTPAVNGYFYNLNDIKYIDFDKTYWNPDVNEALSVGKSLYFTSSDFSLRDKNRVYIMIYNRDMVEDYGLDDVIGKVREGKWTYDTMSQYTKTVYVDLNSDGQMSIEDNWGIGFDSPHGCEALLFGFGGRMVENIDGKPKIVMDSERNVNALDRALDLVADGFYCQDLKSKVDYDFNSVASNLFASKQVLFTTAFPHSLKSRSEKCDFNYGVCPFPKYDENQSKYLSMADVYGMLFSVPVTTPEPDFSGFMLEALSSASEEVLYNYYEVTCKVKHTYDEDSAEMLDLIFDGIVYDLGMVYSSLGISETLWSMCDRKKNELVTKYAKIESKANQKLDEIIESCG